MRLTKHDIEQLHGVEALIKENIRVHYTIEQLARKAGINRDKLKKGFEQLFGLSTHQYLVKLRMDIAKQLLEETDKPVKEIAVIAGYSYTSFITKFGEYHKQTPAAARRSL